MRLVRGARILKQLNEDSTEADLENNIERGFPDTKKRQHATGDATIQQVQFIPYVGTKFLHVKSNCSSTSGKQYHQVIQFVRVAFENEDTDTNATFTGTDGRDYHMEPVDLTVNNVKVRCDCLDFYWRFAAIDFSDNALVGRAPPPYVRKTDYRPPANPMQVPGLCKHLLKLVQHLQGVGLVK
jgi:hypothetical protein